MADYCRYEILSKCDRNFPCDIIGKYAQVVPSSRSIIALRFTSGCLSDLSLWKFSGIESIDATLFSRR